MFTHFKEHDFWLLVPSLILIASSIFFFVKGKQKPAMILLFIGGLGLRFFMAQLDHFLNDWDEKYHALVAEHLSRHFLKPTLIENPVMSYNYKIWVANHIWLHKPPLALWQMAISILIFGANEISIRLPMVFMSAFLIPVIYRIGKIISNERIAYLAAFLWAISYYPLNFVSGGELLEHIDTTFVFYITLSFWVLFEYFERPKWKYVILIGVFAGCAVLTKWLAGLIVFASWGCVLLFAKEYRIKIYSWVQILTAFGITFLLVLPWQVLIFTRYFREAKFEWEFSSKHFSEVVENHSGTPWYYIEQFGHAYGNLSVFFIIPALITLWLAIRKTEMKIVVFSAIVITYVFFSIAQTKMGAFVFIVGPFIFISLASLLAFCIEYIEGMKFDFRRVLNFALIAYLGFISLRLYEIEANHTDMWDIRRMNKTNFTIEYKELAKKIPEGSIVFGSRIPDCTVGCNTEMMFYTKSTVYESYPDSDLYVKLKNQHFRIVAFTGPEMPSYMNSDTSIIKLNDKIK